MTTFPHYYEDKGQLLVKMLDQMDADGATALPPTPACTECRKLLALAAAELYRTAAAYTLGHKRSDRYHEQEKELRRRAEAYSK